jgi:hypothetical protein
MDTKTSKALMTVEPGVQKDFVKKTLSIKKIPGRAPSGKYQKPRPVTPRTA